MGGLFSFGAVRPGGVEILGILENPKNSQSSQFFSVSPLPKNDKEAVDISTNSIAQQIL